MTKIAKNPKTEITAIAQWGNDEAAAAFCTLLVGLNVEDELEFEVGEDDEAEDMVESIESG